MKKLALPVLLLALTGCVYHSRSHYGQHRTNVSTTGATSWPERDRLELVYRIDGNDAILDSEQVTIVFPNLDPEELHSFSFQHGKIAVQIGGEGTSDVSVSCQRNNDKSSFRSHYENGTNTIVFCGREVRIANRGRLLMTSDQRLDSPAGKQQVRVVPAKAS